MLSKQHIETRYYVEHRMIPYSLFGAARRFIPLLMEQQGQLLIEMYHGMNQDDQNYQCPYQPDEFSVQAYNMFAYDDAMNYCIYKIDMPKPDVSPLCFRVYIGLSIEQRKVAYYTVERDPDGLSIICGWDNNGGHLNYGLSPKTEEEELIQINSYFTQGLGIGNC